MSPSVEQHISDPDSKASADMLRLQERYLVKMQRSVLQLTDARAQHIDRMSARTREHFSDGRENPMATTVNDIWVDEIQSINDENRKLAGKLGDLSEMIH
eukprot:290913_1